MLITRGQKTLKSRINAPLRLLRLLPSILLMATLTVLPACVSAPQHGYSAGTKTKLNTAYPAGQEVTTTEPADAEIASEGIDHHAQKAMSMMHGTGPWKWLVGGAMVVMMVVMVL